MGNLFQELRRRKVFRVAAVYAVVAWVLIQVADTLMPALQLPEWTVSLVAVLFLLGFPIAVILAWAYDLVPEGRNDDEARQSNQNSASAVDGKLFYGGLAVFVVVAAIALTVYNGSPDDATDAQATQTVAVGDIDKSIAVLPFTAFSSDPDEQFFADGLSDTLLHNLAQLSDIRVISRTSSFQYRGESIDVRQVGEDLQVATILEGSVQRNNDQLRIIAQLVNTEDGGHIWSQTFDSSSEDIFAIHDEISQAVVQSLQLSMSPEEEERLMDTGTSSVEAFNLFTMVSERASETPLFELNSREYQQQQYFWLNELDGALEIDPAYADVYRRKASIYNSLAFQSFNAEDDAYHLRKGLEAMRQAMLLEPTNPTNFIWYADLTRRSGDAVTAEVFARMAVAELPNDYRAVRSLNLAIGVQGKNAEERLELVKLERALTPFSSGNFIIRREMFALLDLGRIEEAAQKVQVQLELTDEPQLLASDLVFIQSVQQGQHVDALATLIDIRNRLEDNISDTLLSPWLDLTTSVGLTDEINKILPRISEQMLQEISSSAQLYAVGRHAEAKSRLEQFITPFSNNRFSNFLAEHCMMMGDFDCAVNNIIAIRPALESRNNKEPEVIDGRDVRLGRSLVLSYRKIGELDAAERLLQAVFQIAESREVGIYGNTEGYALPQLYLLAGDPDRAIQLIRDRVRLPGDNFIPLCLHCSFSSPLFESLAGNAEFEQLVVEYERRKSINAERMRAMIEEAGY